MTDSFLTFVHQSISKKPIAKMYYVLFYSCPSPFVSPSLPFNVYVTVLLSWMACLSISDGFFFAFCPFFSTSLLPHTQMLCPESCNCASYHSQNFLPRCHPSIPSTVQTQGSRAAHTINRPFPLWLARIDSQFKMRRTVHISKGELIPLRSCTLLWRVQRPAICVRNPIFREPGLFWVWIGSYQRAKSSRSFCTSSFARHMSHPWVHP